MVTRWGDAARMEHASIAAFARFFALARGARDEAALDAAFRQTLLEQEHAAETIPPYLAQGFVNDEGATPYVCVRIPTGGGKTLLGAHALPPEFAGDADDQLAGRDREPGFAFHRKTRCHHR